MSNKSLFLLIISDKYKVDRVSLSTYSFREFSLFFIDNNHADCLVRRLYERRAQATKLG